MRLALIVIAIAASAALAHAERATTRLVRDLAANRARVAARIDPAAGLVFLDHYLEPGEPPGTTSEDHLCGDAVRTFLRTRWTKEVAPAITAAVANKTLACPTATECRAGGQGEWDPVWHFKFVERGGRLVLRAVTEDDEVLVGDADVAAEHAAQDQRIAKLAGRCP